jgi:glutathione S-transferase
VSENRIVLYGFPYSHPCVGVKLMLEHKGLPYTDRRVTPGLHTVVLLASGFGDITVPAARIDGDPVQGSRAIAAALDHRFPETPPLFPAEPAARCAVIHAERRGEELQNAARRIAYLHARRDPSVMAHLLRPGREGELVTRITARTMATLGSAAHRATTRRSRADLRELPARLAEARRWIDAGLIGGDDPNAADFQFAPSLRMLQMFAPVAVTIREAGLDEYVRRLVPDYPLAEPPRRGEAQPDFSTSAGTLA